LVDKGYISRKWRQSVSWREHQYKFSKDDKDLQIRDTIERGEYINDQEWVKIQIHETYELALELEEWGEVSRKRLGKG